MNRPPPFITIGDVLRALATAFLGAVLVVGAGYLYLTFGVPEQTITGLEAN